MLRPGREGLSDSSWNHGREAAPARETTHNKGRGRNSLASPLLLPSQNLPGPPTDSAYVEARVQQSWQMQSP